MTYVISISVRVELSFSASAKAIAPSLPKPLYDKFNTFSIWLDLRPWAIASAPFSRREFQLRSRVCNTSLSANERQKMVFGYENSISLIPNAGPRITPAASESML